MNLSSYPFLQTIPIVHDGFSLLGCSVGPPDFSEATFQTRVDKIKLSLGLLHTLEDSQAQTTLLRSCLALPKVVSVLQAALALLLMILTAPFGGLLRVSWVDLYQTGLGRRHPSLVVKEGLDVS